MSSSSLVVHPGYAGLSPRPIRSTAELISLRHCWGELWQRCPNATPFQSAEWIIPWWRHYGEGPPFCYAFWRGERLVGLAPLYLRADGERRHILLIGTGNSDVLCEPGETCAVFNATLTALAAQRRRWDICDFQELPPGSTLTGALPAGWIDEIRPQAVCPALDLHSLQPELGVWRKARALRRTLERQGQVASELADEASFEEIFAALWRLHVKRWHQRGAAGVLAEPRDVEFQRDAARGFLSSGQLRLHALRCADHILAVVYVIHAQRRSYYYLSGFDPAFARFSPGTQIIASAIEQARRDGASQFDFMRGRECYTYRGAQRTAPTPDGCFG